MYQRDCQRKLQSFVLVCFFFFFLKQPHTDVEMQLPFISESLINVSRLIPIFCVLQAGNQKQMMI